MMRIEYAGNLPSTETVLVTDFFVLPKTFSRVQVGDIQVKLKSIRPNRAGTKFSFYCEHIDNAKNLIGKDLQLI